ncbi:MAG: hypothetical protein ACR2QM_01875 [Longimicrobiales bacterium]
MKNGYSRIASTLVIGLTLCSIAGTAEAQTDAALLGGWVIAEWEAPDGRDGPVPQRGLFVFTESGHYSMMFVFGGARAALEANPSDAQIAAAYNPFVANSGRYSVSGAEVTYEAFVAKDPAYMAGFAGTDGAGNAQTITYGVADGRLTLTFPEGDGPMGGAKVTLRRPGAQ